MQLLRDEEADQDFQRLLDKGEDNLTAREWEDFEDYKRRAEQEYLEDLNFYR